MTKIKKIAGGIIKQAAEYPREIRGEVISELAAVVAREEEMSQGEMQELYDELAVRGY